MRATKMASGSFFVGSPFLMADHEHLVPIELGEAGNSEPDRRRRTCRHAVQRTHQTPSSNSLWCTADPYGVKPARSAMELACYRSP